MKPISLSELCSQATPAQQSADPYLKALCERLQSTNTRSSVQDTLFTYGQTLGYLAGQGAQVELSAQTAQLLVENPQQAALSLAAALQTESRCWDVGGDLRIRA